MSHLASCEQAYGWKIDILLVYLIFRKAQKPIIVHKVFFIWLFFNTSAVPIFQACNVWNFQKMAMLTFSRTLQLEQKFCFNDPKTVDTEADFKAFNICSESCVATCKRKICVAIIMLRFSAALELVHVINLDVCRFWYFDHRTRLESSSHWAIILFRRAAKQYLTNPEETKEYFPLYVFYKASSLSASALQALYSKKRYTEHSLFTLVVFSGFLNHETAQFKSSISKIEILEIFLNEKGLFQQDQSDRMEQSE